MKKADIALVGLAVMGENLVMNMESKSFTVAVYNRTTEKVKAFTEGRAGSAVDGLIDRLIPHLGEGDILVDGSNTSGGTCNV